jgi:hypothetical protein
MYQEIIEPLGHRAKERNDAFASEYAKVSNRFTAQFLKNFCLDDGAIDWNKLVAFNSASVKPAKVGASDTAGKTTKVPAKRTTKQTQ